MTAPADLSSWIAKAREVIARATPGPRWESLGGVLFSGDTCIGSISLDGKGHVYNLSDGDLIVLAVNALPALLDVVEAAGERRAADKAYVGAHSSEDDVERLAWRLAKAGDTLDDALARLAQGGAK